jgi:hypothetical protein
VEAIATRDLLLDERPLAVGKGRPVLYLRAGVRSAHLVVEADSPDGRGRDQRYVTPDYAVSVFAVRNMLTVIVDQLERQARADRRTHELRRYADRLPGLLDRLAAAVRQ